MKKTGDFAIITGAAGGIGQAMVKAFDQAGYAVIATDIIPPPANLPCQSFIQADLQQTVEDKAYADTVFEQIRDQLNGRPLKVLINNAATQILGKVEDLSRIDWQTTLNINLLAPFFWTQALLPELERSKGSVINISSIHARLTKQKFAAYATSKAALSGLTRSMALELGDRVRVNGIEPAAIDTEMLREGFADNPEGYRLLEEYHPTGRIGQTREIADLALVLAGDCMPFMNGAVIGFDGGIGGCLSDPV